MAKILIKQINKPKQTSYEKQKQFENIVEMLQRLFTIVDHIIKNKFPQSNKLYFRACINGFKNFEIMSRSTKYDFNEEDIITISHLYDVIKYAKQQLPTPDKNVMI